MRRLLLLAGCALVLPGCGGGGSSSTTETTAAGPRVVTAGLEPPSGCYVTVFMVEDATKAQIAQVRTVLLANKAISQIAYVSKELQLKRFAKTNPAAAKSLHVNPFADRFEAVPRTQLAVFSIIGEFATRGGPITNVKPSDGCNTGTG